MNKARHVVLAASASLLLLAAPAAQSQSAGAKLARGAAGVVTGVLEIPGNIAQETKTQGAVGVPIGLAKGLGMFVARELVGVYELLTFPFPLPADYEPILHPEYPWSYFAITREP